MRWLAGLGVLALLTGCSPLVAVFLMATPEPVPAGSPLPSPSPIATENKP